MRERRWGPWLAVLSLLLVAVITGGVAWWYGDGRFVQVPPVAGLTQQDATARLDAAGLETRVESRANDAVAAGRAIGTRPPAGDRVVTGRTVTLVLSTGPPPVPVPGVTGEDRGDAETAIREAGLNPVVTEQASPDVDEGDVISQAPSGGRAPRGSDVRLVVSTGPPVVEVPDVRGRSIDTARRILEDAGLRVRVFALGIGTVFRQSPGPGREVEAGTRVTIWGL